MRLDSGGDGMTRWWWIRHGPVPGPPDLIKGTLDLGCDTTDSAAFGALAARLPEGAQAITSSRLRARQTHEALLRAGASLSPALVEPDFDEQNYGVWQGRTWTEIGAQPGLGEFWSDPANGTPPGGESFAAMVRRVRAALARQNAALAGRDIVAVAHGGTIRSALAVALGISPYAALGFAIDTLSLTRIDWAGSGWRVVGVCWPPR